MWHSAPDGITIDLVREERNALEHGRAVLLADADQYVALHHNQTKQCKANRNGSVAHADVLKASSASLKEKVMRDQAVFFSKTIAYRHNHLFTGDRALIVPVHTDWNACVPRKLKTRSNILSRANVVIKKVVVGAKALSWIGGGVLMHRWPKTAVIIAGIGALYLLQLVDVSPVTVVCKAAALSWSILTDALAIDNQWVLKEPLAACFGNMICLLGLYYLYTAVVKTRNDEGKQAKDIALIVESEDSTSPGSGNTTRLVQETEECNVFDTNKPVSRGSSLAHSEDASKPVFGPIGETNYIRTGRRISDLFDRPTETDAAGLDERKTDDSQDMEPSTSLGSISGLSEGVVIRLLPKDLQDPQLVPAIDGAEKTCARISTTSTMDEGAGWLGSDDKLHANFTTLVTEQRVYAPHVSVGGPLKTPAGENLQTWDWEENQWRGKADWDQWEKDQAGGESVP